MGLHVREGVKNHDIHIKPKSYKLYQLGELVVFQFYIGFITSVEHKYTSRFFFPRCLEGIFIQKGSFAMLVKDKDYFITFNQIYPFFFFFFFFLKCI